MTKREDNEQLLQDIYEKALATLQNSVIRNEVIRDRLDYVCRNLSNRAGVRLLMACLLGKLENPAVDPRKPYTEIGTDDSFSGRTLDEGYLTAFINKHRLPCNPTTAFLTPTLRNINQPLLKDTVLVGRPRELYVKTLELLDDVAVGRIPTETLFVETVRILLLMRDEKLARMESLLSSLQRTEDALPLSSEQILNLIRQHLACKGASRLPVLIVAATYQAAGDRLGESIRPLLSHNAADLQTKAIGDVEVYLQGDDAVVTAYEMKMKRVTLEDIDAAVSKIARASNLIHNYIFITTDRIDQGVTDYASKFYDETGGVEIAILDCLGFLRHFLHFFHRAREVYLSCYQTLVLAEPDSAVSSTLKEAFLALRQAAESGD
jgi:AraC-like DNA-binding protein